MTRFLLSSGHAIDVNEIVEVRGSTVNESGWPRAPEVKLRNGVVYTITSEELGLLTPRLERGRSNLERQASPS